MKADKGDSFVVMDRSEYETKIENLLNDQTTYTVIRKPPLKKVERELNAMLLDLKNTEIIPEKTYRQLHLSDAIPPVIRGSIKHHKENRPLLKSDTTIQRYAEPEPEMEPCINYTNYCLQSPRETSVKIFSGGGAYT